MSTVTTGGAQFEIKNVTATTTLTAFSFDHAVNSFSLRARTTTVDLQIYSTEDDGDTAEYFTVPGGQTLSFDVAGQEKQTTAFWMKTSASSTVVEAIGTF